ncbi:MAG TPA: hypothetical protein VNE41_00650 [Chitinophagaceae bacterium]|nr:hypothetical protein [Chitinophagaceae bacterium]
MQIIIDLDGTICSEEKQFSRSLAQPMAGAAEQLDRLYKEGHTLIIYSARGWQEFEMTADWLKRHQIPYHQLVMGKPTGDVWIDDRAIRFEGWEKIPAQLSGIKKP